MDTTLAAAQFSMRGIDYIALIAFFVGLYFFWKYINNPARPARQAARAGAPAPSRWFRVPRGVYFHRGHTWAVPEGKQVVRVGMDDFAQKLLGRPSAIDLPRPGTPVARDKVGWKVQIDSRSIPLISPVDGEVVAVNSMVEERPDLINEEPYAGGWLLKVRVPKVKKGLKGLLEGVHAESWMEDVTAALRLRLGGRLGLVLQDGGVPYSGFATALSENDSDDIAAEFLSPTQPGK